MLRRITVLGAFAIVFTLFAQSASADPLKAKNSSVFTANCGATQLMVSVNGNGEFTPAHVIGSTAVFIPTAFNLTFSFTPTGGTTQSETDTSAKAHQPKNAVTCELPAALNTFTTPLTNGHLKLNYLLPLLPDAVVKGLERGTSRLPLAFKPLVLDGEPVVCAERTDGLRCGNRPA